ncbi:MAG: cell wall-active antibiotics response protein [Chloroflexota bacterium]|nr:cell wall-active antibiotics response protein [Chloroflexota bacterium]
MTADAASPTPPAPRPYRRRGMFWPLLLIGVGLVALLANYGFVQPVSFVSILALWPVLLVLLGIDIAFSRRWPLPTLAAEVVIIGAALLLAATQPSALSLGTFSFGGSNDCSNPAAAVSAPRGALQNLRLTVNGGAARYELTGGATGAVEATSNGTDLCLRDQTSPRGSAAATAGDIRLSQSGSHFGGNMDVTVRVANDLPLSLQMNAGAGDFVVDLHDVKVTDARMSVGASNTTVVLPHPTGDVPVRLDGGASNITIEIPADVEARVVVTGGLISTSSTNPRASKSGGIIETPGYSTAKDRVTVNITGGASQINIR